MKTDEEWEKEIWKQPGEFSAANARAIQADALRHAAELCMSKKFSTAFVASEVIKAEAAKLEE